MRTRSFWLSLMVLVIAITVFAWGPETVPVGVTATSTHGSFTTPAGYTNDTFKISNLGKDMTELGKSATFAAGVASPTLTGTYILDELVGAKVDIADASISETDAMDWTATAVVITTATTYAANELVGAKIYNATDGKYVTITANSAFDTNHVDATTNASATDDTCLMTLSRPERTVYITHNHATSTTTEIHLSDATIIGARNISISKHLTNAAYVYPHAYLTYYTHAANATPWTELTAAQVACLTPQVMPCTYAASATSVKKRAITAITTTASTCTPGNLSSTVTVATGTNYLKVGDTFRFTGGTGTFPTFMANKVCTVTAVSGDAITFSHTGDASGKSMSAAATFYPLSLLDVVGSLATVGHDPTATSYPVTSTSLTGNQLYLCFSGSAPAAGSYTLYKPAPYVINADADAFEGTFDELSDDVAYSALTANGTNLGGYILTK